MTPAQTGQLLLLIKQFDNRELDKAKIGAWHELLSDLEYDDCLAAVKQHFAQSTEYLMPAHIRRNALERRRARAEIRWSEETSQRQAIQAAQARAGNERSPETQAMLAALRKALPAGKPEALRWKDPELAPRRRPATADAGPNPHFAGWRISEIIDEIQDQQ